MIAALVRLAIAGSAFYLVIQVARFSPGLAFPIGVLAAVWAGLWLSAAHYDEKQAMEELTEQSAITEEFGPHMAAIAVEEHHDRWEAQR